MNNQFIGKGITFPIVVNSTGGVDIGEGNDLLQASIKTILYWPKTHRFFNQHFGSRIFEVIEEPNDIISKTLVRNYIFDALNKWEKRIIIKDVKFLEATETTINLELRYIIRSTRKEETMIFPFYKEIIY